MIKKIQLRALEQSCWEEEIEEEEKSSPWEEGSALLQKKGPGPRASEDIFMMIACQNVFFFISVQKFWIFFGLLVFISRSDQDH